MFPARQPQSKIGECEVCPKKDVKLILCYGNMWMCEECKEKEEKISAENMKPENQQKRIDDMNARMKESQSILDRSKEIDMSVQIKPDIFNAATIPAIELKAAINADENIPADRKDFTYYNECCERYLHWKQVTFEKKQEALEAENAMRMWQVQARAGANQLSAELREKFKQADISYQPVPPKTVKPPKEAKTGKKFERQAVNDAAAKYSVPPAVVQMLLTAFSGLTPEKAALHYSNSTSGKTCTDCAACTAIANRKK